jgi:hypothetical protein
VNDGRADQSRRITFPPFVTKLTVWSDIMA